jgi:large subunit ribosomal protein L7/L12
MVEEAKVEETKEQEEEKDQPSSQEEVAPQEKPPPSKKVADILKKVSEMTPEERGSLGLEIVKNLTVLELSQWVKAFEEEFGVSAAVPMAVAAHGAGAAPASEAAAEEQTEFTVVLSVIGPNKIPVIKEGRAATGLGLKEAKALVDGAPNPVKENISKAAADELKQKLEAVGATVEIK